MTRSTGSASLETLLAAIVTDEAAAVQLARATPALAQARVTKERLVEEVPHQLYVGDTALHLAAAALRPRVIDALLDAGADPNAENRRGATALHYACDPRPRARTPWDPSAQQSIIDRLVGAGAKIDHQDRAGAAPLHRAVRARSPGAVLCLLEHGADVHDATHGRQRTTALQLAANSTGASGTRGTADEARAIVEHLLRYGADPGATNRGEPVG